MIYLTEGNTPLNEAYNDEIVQERNNTYQLTFRFPTSDPKWELLKEETFLTADDLHGEQDFYIFEVEKQQGYIQVYANQVISLLNNYIISSIDVDRVSGTRVLSALAGSITRTNPFSFFSDIDDRHTLNIKDKNAMEVLAKDKHSILGQWGGDMVRNGYNLRLLKNGGSENESLFMYKKNLSSYQHKTSTKSLKTRITFKTTVKGEGEKAPDVDYVVVIDSPLLGKYSQIYEAVVEVNDQDVKDQASLIEYGKQYFRTSMCDMLEDNLEISVVGQSDVAVRMFDVVSIYHDWYGLDVRKKITKYTYSPMAKRLKSIGFGTFQSSLANAIGGIVNDAVLNESRNLHKIFDERLKKEIANADRAFDAEFAKREKDITDAIEQYKAKAEEVKQELSDTINQRFDSFDNGSLKEAKRKAEEALKNAGASSLLAQEAKQIGLDSIARLEAFKSQTTNAQTALSGDLDALKQTVTSEVNQASEYRRTTTEALSRMTGQMNGFATKSEVAQGIDGLTQTFAKMKVGSRNYAEDYDFSRGLWYYTQGDNSPQDWTISNGEYNVKGTTKTWKQMQIHSKEGSQESGKSSTALLDLDIGETYTLSFQGICYSGSSSVWLSLRANRTVSDNPEIMHGNFNLTSSWQTYQVTIPALTKPENFDFWRIILGYNEIGHVAFRKVELTRSSTRIDAGPAPEDGKTDLVVAKSEFEKTAEGLSAKMTAVERYVNQDGQRQESLQRYAREESAKQATAVREQISKDYVGKNTFQESVQGVERRLESLSLGTSGNLLKNSNEGFYNQHDKRYRLVETLQANQVYTLVTKYWHGENSTNHTFYDGVGKWQRLNYNKAIDAWMVQFTPTQEIPAGTEIVLSAVPNEAKGNMSWATLVRGAIPLIHWQPAKGDVEEGFTQKLAEYKETVDGRFATISSQINGKANQADFQHVKETSQLYERILGGSGSSDQTVKDNIARLVMTNQLFQTEVGRYSGNGVNRAMNTTSDWGPFISRSGGNGVNLHADLHKILSSGFKAGDTVHVRMEISIDDVQRFNDKQIVAILQSHGDVTNWARAGRTFDYNIGNLQPGNNWRLIEFDTVMTGEMLKNNSWMLNLRVDGASSYKVHTKAVKVEKGNVASAWSPAPEDTDEAIRTVQTQLAGSWSVQNLTSAGSIVSQINATNNQILVEAEKIRFKGKTLADQLTAIDGYFKRLFVGEGNFATLNTEVLKSNSITADKLVMDMAMARLFVSSDIFTNTLASKTAFINKLQSVIVSSTLLEGYKGWIGGFQIGTHDSGYGRWLTGRNHFSVGMGDGEGDSGRTALWVNWGYDWNSPGYYAWFVKNNGKMYCYNTAEFWNTPVVNGDLKVTGNIIYDGGAWIYSNEYVKIGRSSKYYFYLEKANRGRDYFLVSNDTSDRRLKSNIQESSVSGIDVINRLKTYSYRKEFNNEVEDISCGIMAQDVQKYAPDAFRESPDGVYTYNTFALVPYLIKAIQELNQKIEKMEKTIA